ncbi:RNA polymerase sigma factor [Pendulispora albinea]|uniref:Sigma-70 family RNA polymerase sigma factor n=1 Tax=Pendulispora albinea TaxID=2741071 RepID=A0ABZ2M411_9BACT
MLRAALRIVHDDSGPDAIEAAERAEGLVARVRAGEAAAEVEFIAQYLPHVARVLFRISGRRDGLDDLCQEVFLRAFERIDALEDAEGTRAWLTQFAVNVAREAIRARSRRGWLSFWAPADLPDACAVDPTPDRQAEIHDALQAAYEILDSLTPDARAAFVLRYFEDLPLAEVAKACGISVATAKRRIHDAAEIFFARASRHEALRGWTRGGPS